MAIALVTGAHATGSGQNATSLMSVNDAGATFSIAGFGWYAGITADPSGYTDSVGALYPIGTTKQTTATPTSARMVFSTVVGANPHTLQITCATGFIAASLSSWTGVNTASPLDQETGKTAAGTNVITLDALTPSEDNCLIITTLMFEDNSGGAVSINGGFIPLDTVAFNGANNEGLAVAYLIQTTAQIASPTWNVTTSTAALAATMAVIKGPGGGGVSDILMGQVMM